MVFELFCITTIALLFATALIFGGYRFFLFLFLSGAFLPAL